MKLLCLLSLALCAGCVHPNPNQAQNPDGSFPPAYVADTASISNTLAKAQAVIQASAPVNPYAGLLTEAAAAVGALVTAGSILTAKVKSSQAAKAEASKKVMAHGVVKAGAQSSVLEVASSTPHFAEVAHQLNEATP